LRLVTDPTADPSETPDKLSDPAAPMPDPNADPTPPRRPRPTGPVQYRGDDLTPERGPGLGCFRFQLVVLVFFIFLTPLTVVWNWPAPVSAALLFAVIFLLLVTGQTIIFLLRLVAADRRGRRRPLASETRTVGELEDARETPVTSLDDSLDDSPDDDPPPLPERDSPA
jgi:hypothetical protein